MLAADAAIFVCEYPTIDRISEMAVRILISNEAAAWLTQLLESKESYWHWSDDPAVQPTDDDRIYLREVSRALQEAAAGDPDWTGPGSR